MKIIPLGEYAYTTQINETVEDNGTMRIITSNRAIDVPYSNQEELDKVFGIDKKFVNGILADIPHEEKCERLSYRLRKKRERNCFQIINRGKVWYDTLSDAQLSELRAWYTAWLNVTDTLIEPLAPSWLK